ncbi:hypothetical protein DPMN_032442 [Dreissena polymorpha]|uniref:Uncharacterized protein n=1 Tax=Dreissena polymorpha TaxID=45954 RepID=A0A9D4RI91_DREPO|nr:hypothetical protein DPMN_032442 [Dreissena polymorpha]
MLTILWYEMGRVPVSDMYYSVNNLCAVTQQQAQTNGTTVRDGNSDADINVSKVSTVPLKCCIVSPKRPRSDTSVCSGNCYEVLSDSDDTRPSEGHLDGTMDTEDDISTNLPARRITVKRRKYLTNNGSPKAICGHSRERLTNDTRTIDGYSDRLTELKIYPGRMFSTMRNHLRF